MHWLYKKLEYDVLVPKLEKSIFDLNEEEASAYFSWFMKKVPERVEYISGVCAKELHVPIESINCSPESLLLLWKWFRKKAKTEPSTHPKSNVGPAELWKNKRQLSLETEYILRDVGMYLGETFRKNNSHIYWTYYTKPRRDFFLNHPLLKGFVDRSAGYAFEASFEPIHMSHVQAVKILNHSSKNEDLLNLYKLWAEKK